MRHYSRGTAAVLTACLVAIVLAAARPAEPAAVMIQASGAVQLERTGKAVPATVGTSLEPGDRLIIGSGGKAVVMYRTGRIETATSSLTIEGRASEQVGSMYAQTVQTIVQVATTDAARQPNRQGMIRPIPGEPVPVAPRNGIRVLDARPSFTWFSVPDAASYVVQIRRVDADGERPRRFQVGSDTTWTLPSSEPPLVAGAEYRWTVAPRGGRPAQEVAFEVIADADRVALRRSLDDLAAAGVDPAGDGLFVAALRYRDAGLYYDADRALAGLAANGTRPGRTFHLLRGEVLDRLGNLEAAARSFQAADAETGT